MDLKREELLELYKHPLNYGALKDYDIIAKGTNASCGDEIAITVKFDKDKVKDFGFEAKGCAISHVSASLLSEFVKGMSREEIKKITVDEVVNFIGIEVGWTRLKCATLAIKTLQRGIETENSNE